MINALHLLWLIPLVGFLCFTLGAIMAVGKESDEPGKRGDDL